LLLHLLETLSDIVTDALIQPGCEVVDPFLAIWYFVVERPTEDNQFVDMLQLYLFGQPLEVLRWVLDVKEDIFNTLHKLNFL
jgi:hypothetical protein